MPYAIALPGTGAPTMEQAEPRSAIGRFIFSPYTAVILTAFFWAVTTIVVRYVRDESPPIGLSFWRTLAAFIIMLPFCFRAIVNQWDMVRRHWKFLALLSFLLWVGGNALLFVSLQYTIAINVAVINSVEPLFIVVFAWLLFRDDFTWRQGIGLALSLGGVLVLISAGSMERLLTLDLNRGDLIVTGAYVAWGLYAVLLRKLPRDLDYRVTVAAILGFGALFLFPIYVFEAIYVRPTLPTAATLVTIAWLATFSSSLAMILWNYGILKLGAARAGQYLHLIPAFTIVLAIVVLGETFGAHHIAGIVLVAIGLIVAARR
ncbi:MAG: DMT family transporter [Proteobacteria bacterium]|nr:DMT family transporter [Pseudomonadota bacterium]